MVQNLMVKHFTFKSYQKGFSTTLRLKISLKGEVWTPLTVNLQTSTALNIVRTESVRHDSIPEAFGIRPIVDLKDCFGWIWEGREFFVLDRIHHQLYKLIQTSL